MTGTAPAETPRERLARRLRAGPVLAPMAGHTDAPFRRLARAYGATWAITEMVSARALVLGDARGLAISAPHDGEDGVSVQLFAADPAEASDAAATLVAAWSPDAIDVNMGCPVRKVLQRGCGADLMRDPPRAAALVAAVVAAVPVPVTVKTRLGFDRFAAAEHVDAVVSAGASAIALHGRTARQGYAGEADWDAIAAVAARVGVPVLGSGDVRDAASYAWARARGLGVMVARAALGRPWLFRELLGGPPASPAEVAAVSWRHARDHVAWYGAEGALRRLRGQLAAYAAHAGAPRTAFVRVATLDDLADAWRAAIGHDPRDPAVAARDPVPETLATGPAGGRRPLRSAA